MRKQILLPIAAVLSLTACRKNPANDQPPPIPHNKALVWDKNFGGTGYDFMAGQVQLTSGDYITIGNTRSTDGDVVSPPRAGYDFWFARVDVNGNKVWSKTFGNNADEYSTAAVLANDGNVIVTGFAYNQGQNFPVATKISPAGEQLWVKQISNSSEAKPWAIVASGDGNFIVAGYEKSTRGDLDGWVSKINTAGEVLWSKNFGGDGDDQLTGVVKTSDGFALAGYTKSTGAAPNQNRGSYDGWLMKIDNSGNRLWSRTCGGADTDMFKALVQTTDGSLIAVGHSRSTNDDIPLHRGGDDAWVMKFDQSGNKIWAKTFGGLNEEYVFSAAATTDGGVIFGGYTNSTTFDVSRLNNDFGVWVVKMDGAGNKTATSTYGDRGDEVVHSITTTSDGGYMVAGYQDKAGRGYDGLLVKIGPL